MLGGTWYTPVYRADSPAVRSSERIQARAWRNSVCCVSWMLKAFCTAGRTRLLQHSLWRTHVQAPRARPPLQYSKCGQDSQTSFVTAIICSCGAAGACTASHNRAVALRAEVRLQQESCSRNFQYRKVSSLTSTGHPLPDHVHPPRGRCEKPHEAAFVTRSNVTALLLCSTTSMNAAKALMSNSVGSAVIDVDTRTFWVGRRWPISQRWVAAITPQRRQHAPFR
jgi:hypothetical protein